MTLSALIRGKRNTDSMKPASAIPAIPAIFPTDSGADKPKIAKIATLAIATPEATPAPNGGKDLPHYCQAGDCWCSEKLPGSNYPAGCIFIKCEYHHLAVQEAPQTVNELQGILDIAALEVKA